MKNWLWVGFIMGFIFGLIDPLDISHNGPGAHAQQLQADYKYIPNHSDFEFSRTKISKSEKKNGGKSFELTATPRFASKNQRSQKKNKLKPFRFTVSVCIQFYFLKIFVSVFEFIFLRLCAEFTRSIVKDLSEERSPLIFIKRFRNYCTNSDEKWFNFVLFLNLSL